LKGDPRLAGLTGAVFEEQSGKDVLKIIRQWEAFTAARVKHARRVSTLDADQQFRIEFLAEEVGVYKAQWAALKETVVADATPAIVKMLEEIEKSGAMDLLAKDLTALALAFVDITDRLIKFRVAWANGSDAFSLTPAFGVTALRTPKGALSPQERAEDEAAKLRIMRAPGLARSHVQRESAAGMSLEITVKGDTANSRDLARRIAVEVQKLKASEMRAAQ
jgi:hypothetical protein